MDTAASVRHDERGFTLLEVLMAMAVTVAGLLALAYGIGLGLEGVQMSTMDSIAREKAREAMEDVVTARNTGGGNPASPITFSQICNIPQPTGSPNPNNCLFVNGPYPMYTADTSGLVNTNASVNQGTIETFLLPGPDGILGTADDPPPLSLTGFQRQIAVKPVGTSDGYDILVQVTVTITYNPLPWLNRQVVMVAVLSPYV